MWAGWHELSGSAWREAWRGRGDNPLLSRWRLGAGRTIGRRPWWRRSPGLMLICAALSAGATYILVLLLRDYFTVQHSAVASHAFMLGLLKSGVVVVVWAGLAMSLVWLLARLYGVAVFALALLGQGRATDGALRDEALMSSAISDEQVVLAVVLHAWRMLGAPVLALGACGAVVYGLALMEPTGWAVWAATETATPVAGPRALLLAILYFIVTVLGACAGTACLVLLLTVLGRGLGPFAPGIGAAQVVLVQAALTLIVVGGGTKAEEWSVVHQTNYIAVIAALIVCCVLIWLAHQLPLLRMAAVYTALVLVALVTEMAWYANGRVSSVVFNYGYLESSALWHILYFPLALPVTIDFPLGTTLARGAGAVMEAESGLADSGIYFLLQCLLACVFALLARAAVRRYRRGQP
jgi:hypothetical protein